MKKELLKKLKYDMPKEEAGMPEMEISLDLEEEGEEGEMEMAEEEMGLEGGLAKFSVEELEEELARRKASPEEEELEVEELV